ncbi:MAG TPA: DUF6160 family protein [Albitalea sp.]|nr:DUF6160 family protein [Albitalea sp.]
MKLVKTAVAAALASLALSASAMTSIADSDLSQVTGQDGVSIVADLNINIGSFQYTDKDNGGASVAFNNIGISGMMVMTVDVLTGGAFQTAAATALGARGVNAADTTTILTATAAATGFVGNDVVQFAFPTVGGVTARQVAPSITVDSITTGHGGASFGGFALNNIDLQGTKVWMYGH